MGMVVRGSPTKANRAVETCDRTLWPMPPHTGRIDAIKNRDVPRDAVGAADQPKAAAELAARAALGDPLAIRALVQHVTPAVVRTVRGVLGGGSSDVDDVVQQSAMAFIHALPAFRGECDPAGYAGRIAFRTALAARKQRVRERNRASENEADSSVPAHDEHSPSQELAATRRKGLLQSLLDELPVEQSEALVMRTVLGWSLEEVAAASGCPTNTVRSRLRLAKEAMRRRIEANPSLAADLGVDS